jgi:hypothetical protein
VRNCHQRAGSVAASVWRYRNYGLYPRLTRIPGHGSGLGATATVHWSRPSHIHVCSMLARMSRYGPVAAGTRRHRISKGAAQSGMSWHGPALADTG